ncbi:MAG: glycogen debranching enzyme family protein [Candidatus Solibacter usitatus]|nr:glycogen debranching enzyme family protein [Candidatus Solibacter usitatus]
MKPIIVNGDQCRDWSQSSQLEWLEANGIGGFAMGTVSGANTRRYHSLLTAAVLPTAERFVLLSRFEEELLSAGEICNLGAAQYPGIITPTGFHLLNQFRLDPFPIWEYESGDVKVEKKLFLVQGQNTAVIQYRVSHSCRLRVRPFLAFRGYHSLQHENNVVNREVASSNGLLQFHPYPDLPALHLHHSGVGFVPVDHWYKNNEYRTEMERGLDFREDLYSPGWIDFELTGGATAFLLATLHDIDPPNLEAVTLLEAAERSRRPSSRLHAAADEFLVRRSTGEPTIVAGYPWFTDWGRDTMIAIPGLLISRGHTSHAEQIVRGFLQHLDQGLIPNRFPDSGENPEYNTADATLWLFQSVWALQQAGQSGEFIRGDFYPAAKEILRWHMQGTHYSIAVDPADHLLSAGQPGSQLTWMDAKVGDWVVTPRRGKPVEINALWYNALRMMSWWARQFGEEQDSLSWSKEALLFLANFPKHFWNESRSCLYDCLTPEGPDDRIRPNQIFALSLPFPLLPQDRQLAVLRCVEEKLLTPFGLRTLDPAHPEYRGRYHGGPGERDGAYHQGTVWPWLIGPYLGARLNVLGRTPENIEYVRSVLARFSEELFRGCLGTLPELYDGDSAHAPAGAPAQAWTVAEILRIAKEIC